MSENQAVLLLSSCPNQTVGRQLATALLERRLAACVSLLPGAESHFHWQGKIECEREVLLLIKSVAERCEAIETLLHELHPYEVPELLALPVAGGAVGYLHWLAAQCTEDAS